MLSGVGSDRIDGHLIALVQVGVVVAQGAHDLGVAPPTGQHGVDLLPQQIVPAHPASGLQMKLIAWRQLHRLQGLVDKVAGRLGYKHALLLDPAKMHGSRRFGLSLAGRRPAAQQQAAGSSGLSAVLPWT